jgi:hypothetical protein
MRMHRSWAAQNLTFERNCKSCGKLFTATNSRQIFCDAVCQQRLQQIKLNARRKSERAQARAAKA